MAELIRPTLFRGLFWDAGWEFDAPCVVYYPFKRYGYGGNSSVFDRMVEDMCVDVSFGRLPSKAWSADDLEEFNWRGWSPRGFTRRKQAWHLQALVEWGGEDEDGHPLFEVTDRHEQWGEPFRTRTG